MRLPSELVKLPLKFDSERLADEVCQFTELDWISNPSGLAGNSALILVSVRGEINDEFALSGQMQPTEFLQRCPYMQQVFKAIEAPISRSRLMRLAPRTKVGTHLDARYHWYRRIRIHIPIITHPDIEFTCNGKRVHMGAGEAWTFDGSLPHGVVNPTKQERIHLVIDTKGSEALNNMLQQESKITPRYVPYIPGEEVTIPLETYCFEVLTTQEIEHMMTAICNEAETLLSSEQLTKLLGNAKEFSNKWEIVFSQYGHDRAGKIAYQKLLDWFTTEIKMALENLLPKLSSSWYYISVIHGMLTVSNRVYY